MDRIDEMLFWLRRALPEVTWDRDAVSEDAPDNVGAVEFTGTRSMWADDRMIDQRYVISVWLMVSSSSTDYLGRVQEVLDALAEYDDFSWHLPERRYAAGVDQVIWRWECESDGMDIPPEREYALREAVIRDGTNQL